jgi:hypothetical protein
VIEELAIDAQLGLWPYFFQKQTLAPTVVRNNHIGHKALCFHNECGSKACFSTNGFGLKV